MTESNITKEVIIMGKRPTLQAVADKAGVSRGTVDRVLNNRANVSAEVFERVTKAMEETGYISKKELHIQNLQKRSAVAATKLGVLLPNWTGHFKTEILRGIEAAKKDLEDLQVEIFVEECQTDVPQEALELLEYLLKQGVQGIALCVPDVPTITERIRELTGQKIPVVTFNSDLPECKRLCFVGQDYRQSGRIAAELICKCIPRDGHVLAVIGNREFEGHRTRLNGFKERFRELDFSDSQMDVIETYNDYQITYRKVLDYLKESRKIHGIYMANRSVSGCAEAVRAAGKKGEVRVICHDLSQSTKLLLQNGSVDFAITQNIYRQGYLPLIVLREYLQKNKLPADEESHPQISIICSQNL